MNTDKAEEMNAEYAPMFWGINYILCGVVFVQRAMHLWGTLRSRPTDMLGVAVGGLVSLYCFLPLWAGRIFRRRLKGELEKSSMSTQTFSVCDWRIAQLLFIAYMGILVLGIRS